MFHEACTFVEAFAASNINDNAVCRSVSEVTERSLAPQHVEGISKSNRFVSSVEYKKVVHDIVVDGVALVM